LTFPFKIFKEQEGPHGPLLPCVCWYKKKQARPTRKSCSGRNRRKNEEMTKAHSLKRLFDVFQWLLPSHPHSCPLPTPRIPWILNPHYEIAHQAMQLKSGIHIDSKSNLSFHTRTRTTVGLPRRTRSDHNWTSMVILNSAFVLRFVFAFSPEWLP